MARAEIRIRVDRDWLALNAYRMALEAIMKRNNETPWGFSGEDAAELAEHALTEFPGSFGPLPGDA